MRCSKGGPHEEGGKHISGAERILREDEIEEELINVYRRAITHERGKPDFINLKIEEIDEDDIRFKDNKVASSLCKFLENEINCKNIDFNTITDYIILISFLLKNYGLPKNEINKFINDFEKNAEEFRNKISINIYNQVIYTDNKLKLNALLNYVKK